MLVGNIEEAVPERRLVAMPPDWKSVSSVRRGSLTCWKEESLHESVENGISLYMLVGNIEEAVPERRLVAMPPDWKSVSSVRHGSLTCWKEESLHGSGENGITLSKSFDTIAGVVRNGSST
jgi:hypothetical protein